MNRDRACRSKCINYYPVRGSFANHASGDVFFYFRRWWNCKSNEGGQLSGNNTRAGTNESFDCGKVSRGTNERITWARCFVHGEQKNRKNRLRETHERNVHRSLVKLYSREIYARESQVWRTLVIKRDRTTCGACCHDFVPIYLERIPRCLFR